MQRTTANTLQCTWAPKAGVSVASPDSLLRARAWAEGVDPGADTRQGQLLQAPGRDVDQGGAVGAVHKHPIGVGRVEVVGPGPPLAAWGTKTAGILASLAVVTGNKVTRKRFNRKSQWLPPKSKLQSVL